MGQELASVMSVTHTCPGGRYQGDAHVRNLSCHRITDSSVTMTIVCLRYPMLQEKADLTIPCAASSLKSMYDASAVAVTGRVLEVRRALWKVAGRQKRYHGR